MPKICIGSLNTCIRRNLDAQRIRRYFEVNGHEIVERPEDGDYTFVFTCAFTERASAPNLEEIERLDKTSRRLVVCGCLPAIEPKKLKGVFSGKTIVTSELHRIDEEFPENPIRLSEVDDQNDELVNYLFSDETKNVIVSYLNREARGDYDKILRITNGCLGRCSYCAIRRATGTLRSKPLQNCLGEYKRLLRERVRSICIDGEDTGAYGIDIGCTFTNLLGDLMLANEECSWSPELFIRSFNPVWLAKYYEDIAPLLKEVTITRINCPLQSGSNRVLRLMNRYANVDLILEKLRDVKRAHPDIWMETHFIIGFPSESEDDFLATVSTCKSLPFDSVELYAYSDKDGTEAYQMGEKIPNDKILERVETAKNALERDGIEVITYKGPV